MCRNRDPGVRERGYEIMRGYTLPACNCGYPYDDHPDHSPDCPVEIAWEAAFDQAERELMAT